MRVLVTGGAGFIGSHVVDALLARGDEVLVVDDLSSGDYANVEGHLGKSAFRFVEGDITNLHGRDDQIDGVVHLAAQVSVARSVEAPFEDMHTNARGLVQVLLFAAAQAKPAKVVYASSAAVYGDVDEVPTPESARCAPLSPYGIHKLAAEMHLRVQARLPQRPLSAVSLRFFNVYGSRQDPRSHYAGVIARFVERALAGLPIEIFGDGQQTRDFIHVTDVVQAVLSACERGPSDGTPINVGGGQEISIRELAERIVALTGSESPIVHLPARSGEVRRSRASVERSTTHLEVRPTVDLDRGLREFAAWVAGLGAPGLSA